MTSFENMALPALAVNGYLWDTMKRIDDQLSTRYGSLFPFFPIGDSVSGQEVWENKPYFVYDRVFRYDINPFYPSKRETILYDLKANEIESLLWGSAVQLILDRYDDAAKDINDWIRNHENAEEYPIYFHYLNFYQARAQASSGSLQEESTSPKYVTTFMIDACYHITQSLEDFFV